MRKTTVSKIVVAIMALSASSVFCYAASADELFNKFFSGSNASATPASGATPAQLSNTRQAVGQFLNGSGAPNSVANESAPQSKFEYNLKYWTEAIQRDPKNADNYAKRGDVYRRQQMYGEALTDLNKAIVLSQTQPIYYQLRAATLMHLNRRNDEISDLTQALKFSPNDWQLLGARAGAFIATKQYQPALGDLDQALKVHPDELGLLIDKGSVLVALNRPDEGLIACNQALKINSNSGYAYRVRAQAYKQLGQDQFFEQDIKRARALGYLN